MTEDYFTAEPDDTVEFIAPGDYGEVSGTGTVIRAFNNGAIIVEMARPKIQNGQLFCPKQGRLKCSRKD